MEKEVEEEKEIDVSGNGKGDWQATLDAIREAREKKEPPSPESRIFDVKTLMEEDVIGAWTDLPEKFIPLYANQEAMEALLDPDRTVPISKIRRDSHCKFALSSGRGARNDAVALSQSKQEEKEEQDKFVG